MLERRGGKESRIGFDALHERSHIRWVNPPCLGFLRFIMTSFSFPDWPPTLTETQLNALTLNATTYALSHGLLYLPPTTTPPPFPNAAIHAPLSLIPSPLPRSIFNKALSLQRAYNVLYSRIAMDVAFLDRVMGADVGVGKVDDFVGNLWKGWKECRREGIAQARSCLVKKNSLG